MGLVGYCGRVLGNTVDITFRKVIRFYAYLSKWTLTVR